MNDDKQYVTPVNGVHVVDPATMQPIATPGQWVTGNELYWLRRVSDGDVITGEPLPAKRSKLDTGSTP